MRFARHKQYKRTGIDWLPEVPEQWRVSRSDNIVSADRAQVAPEAFIGREVFHYSIPAVQERGTGQSESGDRLASAKQVVTKPVVLVSKLNPRKATICIARPQPGMLTLCSTEFVALNADRCELRFLDYLVRSELFRQLLDSKVQSVTRSHQRAKPDDIYKFWNAWPGAGEQRAIADFLDRETAGLDTLVSKKRELIEKLKEKRIALISRTVTRGLRLDVQMKSSDLKALPEIPNTWKPSKVWLERVAENLVYQNGNHGELHPKAEDYVSDGIPFVMANHIVAGRIDFEVCNYIEPEFAASLRIGFAHVGDVLLTHKGTIGRVGMVQENRFPYVMLTPQVTYYRCLRNILPRYLFWFFQGKYWQDQMLLVSGLGTTRGYVGLLDQRFLALLIPPTSEQQAIGDYLDRETGKLDKMVKEVEAAIEKLQEYRTALITAAVTGKIDVRESPKSAVST